MPIKTVKKTPKSKQKEKFTKGYYFMLTQTLFDEIVIANSRRRFRNMKKAEFVRYCISEVTTDILQGRRK